MRVVPCMVLLVSICFSLAGCEAFNRRKEGNNLASSGGKGGERQAGAVHVGAFPFSGHR